MRLRGLWDVAALPRAYIAKVAEQKGAMYNAHGGMAFADNLWWKEPKQGGINSDA